MTRIIGYLKRVSNFSAARQQEASRSFYYTPTEDILKMEKKAVEKEELVEK
jgi:ribonucleoside-triphosphate reductase